MRDDYSWKRNGFVSRTRIRTIGIWAGSTLSFLLSFISAMAARFLSPVTLHLFEELAATAYDEIQSVIAAESVHAAPQVTIHDISRIILDAVHPTVCAALSRHNLQQRINSLPPEVLVAVFDQLLTPLNRVQAALVCKKWHDVIFNSPSLWRTINCRSYGLAEQLELSGQSTLWLTVVVDLQNIDTVVASLPTALRRCIVLNLTMYVDMEDLTMARQAIQLLSSALRCPAPLLEEVTLRDPQLVLLEPSDEPLFGESSQLSLAKIEMDLGILRRSNLSTFQNVQRCLFGKGGSAWSLADIGYVLELFPKIRALALEIPYWEHLYSSREDEHEEVLSKLTLPPQLDVFTIVTSTATTPAAAILARLRRSKSCRICVSHNITPSDNQANALLKAYLEDIPQLKVLRIEASGYDDAAVNIYMYRGDREIHESTADLRQGQEVALPARCIIDYPISAGVPSNMFHNLTHLYMSELIMSLALKAETRLPETPSLVELTIHIMRHKYQSADGPDSIFFLPRLSDPDTLLCCPRLQVVRIATRTDSARTALSPEMILDFVIWHLKFDTERLRSLKLLGVEILQHDVAQVARLLEIFEEIDVEPGRMVWQREDVEPIQW